MPDSPGPMVSRRQLGAALRQYRLDAGKTVGQAAEHLMCHSSKITRIEKAQRGPSPRDVRDLVDFYGIEDAGIRDLLMRLAQESRETAWWQNLDLPPAFERFFGLESSAAKISEYQVAAVPGLLQTRDYATAIVRAWEPNDQAVVEEAVDIRMMRQENLASASRLHFIVDEAVVRRAVGGAAVMRDQIDHLIQLTMTSQVQLQVIPFSRGAHRGMISGFTVLQFDDSLVGLEGPSASDVVHIEGLGFSEAIYLDRAGDVRGYLRTFETLRDIALTADESIPFLQAIQGSFAAP